MGKNFMKICLFVIILNIPFSYSEINKTIEEKICQNIYYFIIEKNWDYTNKDLINLSEKIKENSEINVNLLKDYIDNYEEKCYLKEYSNKLPKKLISTINITKKWEIKNCSLSMEFRLLDVYFPIHKINLGSNLTCEQINKLRLFISIEKKEDNYYFRGIKMWVILLLISSVFFVWFWKTGKLENFIDRFKEGKFIY